MDFHGDFSAGYTKEEKKKVHQYQQNDRFEKTKETEAISRAKFQ